MSNKNRIINHNEGGIARIIKEVERTWNDRETIELYAWQIENILDNISQDIKTWLSRELEAEAISLIKRYESALDYILSKR